MNGPALPPGFLTRPIAHRALHGAGAPENSRAAVAAAVAAGYGIEIDLQASSDGVAMVFHDAELQRLTEADGPVSARDAAALGGIALRGSDEGIPTFAEVLRLVGGRVPLVVEIKDRTGTLGPGDGVLEQAAARDAAAYDGPLAFMSFNPHSVARIAALAPRFARGLVTCAFAAAGFPGVPAERRAALARIEEAEALGASFVSHEWTDLANPRLAEQARQGRAILCWTIRSPAAEAEALRRADNITFEGYRPGLVS